MLNYEIEQRRYKTIIPRRVSKVYWNFVEWTASSSGRAVHLVNRQTDRPLFRHHYIPAPLRGRATELSDWIVCILICAPIHVHLPNLSLCLCFSSYPLLSEEKGALTLFTLNVHSIYHWLVLAKLPLYWFCLCFSESFVCKQYYL